MRVHNNLANQTSSSSSNPNPNPNHTTKQHGLLTFN